MNVFDICAVVAPDKKTRDQFRAMVVYRREARVYPRELEFRFLSDPEGGRLESGGGTVYAVQQLADELADGKRVLLIHAGGESRRTPCYAPEGKLFAPIAVPSSSLVTPIVLDALLDLFVRYPWQNGELVVTSGDVVLDFDTESVIQDRGEVCGFAAPASLDVGARHGVFEFDRNRKLVLDYHQKQPADFLRSRALLPGTDQCALDIGIVAFSEKGVKKLLYIGEEMHSGLERGRKAFSLYRELLTAAVSGIKKEEYRERVGPFSSLDREDLTFLYSIFENIGLRGSVVKRSAFLHYGSLADLASSNISLFRLGITPFFSEDEDNEISPHVENNVVICNCEGLKLNTAHAAGNKQIYAENCENTEIEEAAGSNVFTGLEDRSIAYPIPEGICLDERPGNPDSPDGDRVILVYGINDTFRPADTPDDLVFCGTSLPVWLKERGLVPADIWDTPVPAAPFDLLQARLFPPEFGVQDLPGFWDAGQADNKWCEKFKKTARMSITEANTRTSAACRDRRRAGLRGIILKEQLFAGKGWSTLSAPDYSFLFDNGTGGERKQLVEWYENTEDDLLKMYRRQCLVDAGFFPTGEVPEKTEIHIDYVAGSDIPVLRKRAVKDDQVVWARCPVRLDVAGGWTDTPPYTLREGGTVVNLAADLNGQPPIQVFCRPTQKPEVMFHSIDLGSTETVDTFGKLENYHDPDISFALPRAALTLLGLNRDCANGNSLKKALEKLGGGLEVTLLSAVPKGSGLGTSSILAATILAALERFFGIESRREELYRQVLEMEQLLTTGGGWQDQIGGVAGGVKIGRAHV
jgi:hypothetical protein